MENKIRLETKEVEVLIESLDAWITKDNTSSMLGSMLLLSMSDDKEKAKAEIRSEHEKERIEQEKRKRKATMLKAKLFQYQESLMDEKSDVVVSAK